MTPNRHPARRPSSRLVTAWPWVCRFTGLGIILWETLGENLDRPSILTVALVLLGFDRLVSLEHRGRNGNGQG